MNTEIQYEEWINAIGPLLSASRMIENLSGDFFDSLKEALKSAQEPLLEHIKQIERANPDKFT